MSLTHPLYGIIYLSYISSSNYQPETSLDCNAETLQKLSLNYCSSEIIWQCCISLSFWLSRDIKWHLFCCEHFSLTFEPLSLCCLNTAGVMEPVDSGYFCVRENGCLRDSFYIDLGCSVRYSQKPVKQTAQSQSTLFTGCTSAATVESKIVNNEVQPCRTDSLFGLCCSFVARNIMSVDSLVDFPDTIGKVIFDTVLEDKILQSAIDDQCARILQTFSTAYEELLMEELKVTYYCTLENHLCSVCSFHFLTKLDISRCRIGDGHDILLHIGNLKRWVHALVSFLVMSLEYRIMQKYPKSAVLTSNLLF